MAIDTEFILRSTRSALGIGDDTTAFDPELLLYINSALAILGQNGCGNLQMEVSEATTWADFKDATQTNGNDFFSLVPVYVYTRTKILFDPPPPSNVEYFNGYINELIWRIKIAFEADETEPIAPIPEEPL